MKLAIYLGSFDPPHIGHISIVSEILNAGIVDKILVIPAYQNPWKEGSTNFGLRCQMVDCALASFGEKVLVIPIEEKLSRSGESVYSYDTLTYLKQECFPQDELFLVTSGETLEEIHNWHRGADIYNQFPLIIMYPEHLNRRDYPLREQDLAISYQGINICSTTIRERIKAGKWVSEYIPYEVGNIIKNQNLYEKENQ